MCACRASKQRMERNIFFKKKEMKQLWTSNKNIFFFGADPLAAHFPPPSFLDFSLCALLLDPHFSLSYWCRPKHAQIHLTIHVYIIIYIYIYRYIYIYIALQCSVSRRLKLKTHHKKKRKEQGLFGNWKKGDKKKTPKKNQWVREREWERERERERVSERERQVLLFVLFFFYFVNTVSKALIRCCEFKCLLESRVE